MESRQYGHEWAKKKLAVLAKIFFYLKMYGVLLPGGQN